MYQDEEALQKIFEGDAIVPRTTKVDIGNKITCKS